MAGFWGRLLGFLFPDNLTCIFCGDELNGNATDGVCDECFKELPFNNGKVCVKCGVQLKSDANICMHCKNTYFTFLQARSSFVYEGKIAHLVKTYKYDNKMYLSKVVAPFMVNTYLINKFDADVIIPVPLYKWRKFHRGFNQSELLANQIGKTLNIPVVVNNLVRVRKTKTQTKLTSKEREVNLTNAFRVLNAKELKGKKVLLVDDVFTTGSTVEFCARELQKADVNKTLVLCLASVSQYGI
ncbi:MAG: ComF family protein [Firmicutes bacterium]|nr:ComF family protein [Bacillota bacterium]